MRRSECVPYSLGSSPTLPIQSDTRRAYWRVVMLFWGPRRPANKNSPGFLLVALRYSSTAWRVCSVNSNRTGRPVFFWRTVARSAVYPPAATSSTLMNPLDRYERFQLVFNIILLSCSPDATTLAIYRMLCGLDNRHGELPCVTTPEGDALCLIRKTITST